MLDSLVQHTQGYSSATAVQQYSRGAAMCGSRGIVKASSRFTQDTNNMPVGRLVLARSLASPHAHLSKGAGVPPFQKDSLVPLSGGCVLQVTALILHARSQRIKRCAARIFGWRTDRLRIFRLSPLFTFPPYLQSQSSASRVSIHTVEFHHHHHHHPSCQQFPISFQNLNRIKQTKILSTTGIRQYHLDTSCNI